MGWINELYPPIFIHIVSGKIWSGKWPIGHNIPTKSEMMKIYSKSFIIAYREIENKVKEGNMERTQVKGNIHVSAQDGGYCVGGVTPV
jgi:hypothetical protein